MLADALFFDEIDDEEELLENPDPCDENDRTNCVWTALEFEYEDTEMDAEDPDNGTRIINSYRSDEFRREFGNIDAKTFQKFGDSITKTQICLITAYSSLFILGILGNSWIACIHCSVWRYTRSSPTADAPRAVQIYILALCVCDLIVLIFLSALISDIVYGQWMIPSIFLCRLYLTSESINKFGSPFLLVAMSGYCYFSICRPSGGGHGRIRPAENGFLRYFDYLDVRRWSESRLAVLIVFATTALVLLLVSPVYIYGDLHYVVFESIDKLDPTNRSIDEIAQKCAFEPPSVLQKAFMIYSFIGGYVVPAASFTLFYTLLLHRVRVQASTMRRRPSSEYFGRVAKTTTGLVLFYLLCWTPYWSLMLYQSFGLSEEDTGPPPVASVVFGYIIHTLPYINCTGYPILYTLINRSIKEAYRKVTVRRRNGQHHQLLHTNQTNSGKRSDCHENTTTPL